MNTWTSFASKEDEINSTSNEVDSSKVIWQMTNEQQLYYIQQYKKIIPTNFHKIPGSIAKEFFELSKLDIEDLRNIWELADQDKDGCLTLGEFCVAMHLVVLRKNGLMIPTLLPTDLIPYLNVDFSDVEYSKKPLKTTVTSKDPKLLKRLPSNSSLKSDAMSLTEGMTAFDNEPPQGDKISYPVPFKPNLIPSILSKPAGPSKLILENKLQTNIVNTFGIMELKAPELPNSFGGSAESKTPPVPPRFRWPSKPSDNSNSFSAYDDNIHSNEPLLDNNNDIVDNVAYGINFSQSPESIVMGINANSDSNVRKEAYNFLVNTTRMQCDTLSAMNEEMSRNLKQLQQQRISLEIQLEKMMPLNYG